MLTLIWAAIIAFGVFMYVLMDGFDLGIGILFPLAPSHGARDRMMNAVAPIWDGNETWLALGGTALFAAFPMAYGILLSAFYLPLIVMLIGLIFRGVAFEFRFKAGRSRILWDWAFAGGSMIATFCQGMVLGTFVQGVPVEDGRYTGGFFGFLTPFSLMTGLALAAGYALLGAGWVIVKTDGDLQGWAYKWATRLVVIVTGFVGIVSLWAPFLDTDIAQRWFSWPNIAYLSPVPIAVAVVFAALIVTIRQRRQIWQFILSIGLFALAYLGLGISLWPNVIPPSVSIWEAASPPESQIFLLAGAAVVIPIVLAYTGYSYWVFRGKVGDEGFYH